MRFGKRALTRPIENLTTGVPYSYKRIRYPIEKDQNKGTGLAKLVFLSHSPSIPLFYIVQTLIVVPFLLQFKPACNTIRNAELLIGEPKMVKSVFAVQELALNACPMQTPQPIN